MPRGGKREGAGRPQTGKARLVVHLTHEERQAVLKVIEGMRDEKGNVAGKDGVDPFPH